MRRLLFSPRSHLKCFTALVTYTFERSIPASSAVARYASVREHTVVDMSPLDFAGSLCFLAVLLGLVVLLAILVQSMVSLDRTAADLVSVARIKGLLKPLDELPMRFLAVLTFGV